MVDLMQRAFGSPKRVLLWSAFAVLLAGSVAPVAVLKMTKDGGFNKYGWNIDLAKWPILAVDRAGIPGVHTDLVTVEDGVEHKEIWLNSGQSLVFREVPATSATEFKVLARVHPDWNPGMALERLSFHVSISSPGGMKPMKEAVVSGDRAIAGAWQDLTVDLSPYSGSKVDIEIRPEGWQAGIWTLWRDPQVSVRR